MNQILLPFSGSLSGEINLPASKSISNRALILNALAHDSAPLSNLSDCNDTRVMVQALNSDSSSFDIGAAGTAMRFLTAFLSKIAGEWTLTGSERMKQRPVRLLVDALNALGAKISYLEQEGFPPLRIEGRALDGGAIALDGGVSSQYISALLMVAPTMRRGLTLRLTGNVISRPYILLTLQMMSDFGIRYDWTGDTIRIEPQEYVPAPFTVEADWSAASYWYELLAIVGKGSLTLKGLRKNSYQGDSRVAELFEPLGVQTKYVEGGVEIASAKPLPPTPSPQGRGSGSLTNDSVTQGSPPEGGWGACFNFIEQPDLAQTFAVTCCALGIPFRFSGVQSLKIKETDRVAALIAELRKAGFALHEPAAGELAWDGSWVEAERQPLIRTYEDHRMAMAFAPLCATGQALEIEHPEVVNKSYLRFWDDWQWITQKIS